MVPGPLPMVRASMTVTAHATAASAATAIHGTASCRGGRACTGRMTEAGPAWSAIAQPSGQPSYRKSVTKLLVPEKSALQ